MWSTHVPRTCSSDFLDEETSPQEATSSREPNMRNCSGRVTSVVCKKSKMREGTFDRTGCSGFFVHTYLYSGEHVGHPEGVGGQGAEPAEGDDAVRVDPHEVGLVRVQLARLDQADREVVGQVAPQGPPPDEPVSPQKKGLSYLNFFI